MLSQATPMTYATLSQLANLFANRKFFITNNIMPQLLIIFWENPLFKYLHQSYYQTIKAVTFQTS